MYENHSPEIKIFYICCALKEKQNARMVKLVDTLVSGTSDRKVVQVRVLFRAQKRVRDSSLFYFTSVCCEFSYPRQLQKWKHDGSFLCTAIISRFKYVPFKIHQICNSNVQFRLAIAAEMHALLINVFNISTRTHNTCRT